HWQEGCPQRGPGPCHRRMGRHPTVGVAQGHHGREEEGTARDRGRVSRRGRRNSGQDPAPRGTARAQGRSEGGLGRGTGCKATQRSEGDLMPGTATLVLLETTTTNL